MTLTALLELHIALLGVVQSVAYRLVSRDINKLFLTELAESLESLAARVRRAI